MRSSFPCLGLLVALLGGCKSDPPASPDLGPSGGSLAFSRLTVRVQMAALMRAAIDMQHSGEPLAQAMGRNLNGYDANSPTPDQYSDPLSHKTATDLAGYSAAVESYQYSKYMMNGVAFESGPGLSLMYGPLLNPSGQGGAAAVGLLASRVQALAIASRAGVDANGPWVIVPPPVGNPFNTLGLAGLWPQFAELRAFAPDIAPSGNVVRSCTFAGGYGGAAGASQTVGDYECGYSGLHLNRDAADKVLELDGLGYAAWKQALWVINYAQLVHDPSGAAFSHVADADVPLVGKPGNSVRADSGSGTSQGRPGSFIGSTDLEGFQGLLMVEELDNKAALLLKRATTTDGQQLGGFADWATAVNYDYSVPLRYFPHAIAVTEQPGSGGAEAQPSQLTLQSGDSQLADLVALLGAYGEVFALTDRKNPEVGGSSTTRPIFDGDPYPSDNGLPDGESTLHDRALAVLKVALVNLERLHSDPATGGLCDSARLQAGAIVRTRHATTVEIAQAIVGLRTAYRALTAQLTLYSNATPDSAVTSTALDGTSLAGAPAGSSVASRLQLLIKSQADLLSSKLLSADGLAVQGWDLAAGTADNSPTTVDSQAAAVRGLLEAYLATSQSSYRDRAQAAYAVLEQRFYDPARRAYRTTLGDDTSYVWTPVRFATVQAALRQVYLLIGSRPGGEALAAQLESRLGRLNKLVLNGWDDRNSNGIVDYPGECLRFESGLPRGGLMLAERALTGETGSLMGALTSDRDHDCVPEVDDAKLMALLASELVLVGK